MEKKMLNEREDAVLTSREACNYFRISRPTYANYLYTGRIKGPRQERVGRFSNQNWIGF
jgi:predicted site-specific integrase-resolvase